MTTSVVNPAEPVDYASTDTPSSYVCGDCGKSGVKLWRDYQSFLRHQALRCVDCAGAKANVDVSMMKADGQDSNNPEYTESIGWLIPAIPTQQNNTFWATHPSHRTVVNGGIVSPFVDVRALGTSSQANSLRSFRGLFVYTAKIFYFYDKVLILGELAENASQHAAVRNKFRRVLSNCRPEFDACCASSTIEKSPPFG